MGHLNLPSSKRNVRQWRLLDLVSAAFFAAVLIFFLLLCTPLGDSLAASGRQTLLRSASGDPRQRSRLIAQVKITLFNTQFLFDLYFFLMTWYFWNRWNQGDTTQPLMHAQRTMWIICLVKIRESIAN